MAPRTTDEDVKLTALGHKIRAEVKQTLKHLRGGPSAVFWSDDVIAHIAVHVSKLVELTQEKFRDSGHLALDVSHVNEALQQLVAQLAITDALTGSPIDRLPSSGAKPNAIEVTGCLAFRTQILGNAKYVFHQYPLLDLLVKFTADKTVAFISAASHSGTDPRVLVQSEACESDFAALTSLDEKVKVKVAAWCP